jgi:hypothetical protein
MIVPSAQALTSKNLSLLKRNENLNSLTSGLSWEKYRMSLEHLVPENTKVLRK